MFQQRSSNACLYVTILVVLLCLGGSIAMVVVGGIRLNNGYCDQTGYEDGRWNTNYCNIYGCYYSSSKCSQARSLIGIGVTGIVFVVIYACAIGMYSRRRSTETTTTFTTTTATAYPPGSYAYPAQPGIQMQAYGAQPFYAGPGAYPAPAGQPYPGQPYPGQPVPMYTYTYTPSEPAVQGTPVTGIPAAGAVPGPSTEPAYPLITKQ